jgi:hypothetical protein
MLNLHQQLAEAQAALRDAEDTFKLVKAKVEQEAIASAFNDYGKNERDRERFLTNALAGDIDYARALLRLRRSELAVDQLKAALAMQEDDRRTYEWSVRAALAEALGGQREPFEAAMDEAVDDGADRMTATQVGRQPQPNYSTLADDVEVPAAPQALQRHGLDRDGYLIDTSDWYGRD